MPQNPSKKKNIFTDPTAVEKAFYEAFGRRDVNAMMSVWAEDEEIFCVHPTGLLLKGYEAVRHGWNQLLTESGADFSISVSVRQRTMGVMLAFHQVVEEITVRDGNKIEKAYALALNIFTRTPDGWRLMVHQATPSSPDDMSFPHQPSSHTLH